MTYLLDTNLLIWAVFEDHRVPLAARRIMTDASNELVFSVASIWEVAIKSAKHEGFFADATKLRDVLLSAGYRELTIQSSHAITTASLPFHHRDPFDRLLVAQAIAENIQLITVDAKLSAYSDLVITI